MDNRLRNTMKKLEKKSSPKKTYQSNGTQHLCIIWLKMVCSNCIKRDRLTNEMTIYPG